MRIAMIWKSISSSGLEYFNCVKGLEFKSYVCQLCVTYLFSFLNIC